MTVTRTVTQTVTDTMTVTYGSDRKMVGDMQKLQGFLKNVYPAAQAEEVQPQSWREWAGEKGANAVSLAVKVAGVVALVSLAYEYDPSLLARLARCIKPLSVIEDVVITTANTVKAAAQGAQNAYETTAFVTYWSWATAAVATWGFTAVKVKKAFFG